MPIRVLLARQARQQVRLAARVSLRKAVGEVHRDWCIAAANV